MPAAFAGADADAIVEGQDKDLAVADLAGLRGAGGVDDGFDGGFNKGVVDGDFHFQFGQQADLHFRAAVELGVAALPAATANVADGHQIDVPFVQGGLHRFQFFRTNNGDDELHGRDLEVGLILVQL